GIRDFHVTGVQTCALPISGDDLAEDAGQHLGRAAAHLGLLDADVLNAVLLDHPERGRVDALTAGEALSRLGGYAVRVVRRGLLRSEERRVGREGECRCWLA